MANMKDMQAAAEEFLDDLARGIDPLAFENDNHRDQVSRRRQVYARVRLALREYDALTAQSHEMLTYEEWVKGTTMTPEVTKTEPKVDPLLVLTLELAALIDFEACAGLKAEGFKPALLTDAQDYAVKLAGVFIQKVCFVAEQEYAVYLFRNRAKVA